MNGTLLVQGASDDYTYAAGVITFNAATTVTGDIVIDAVYTVTVNGTGLTVTPTTVTFDEVAVLTLAGTAPYDVKVTMDGSLLAATLYAYAGGVITFNAGTTVTGDIVIDAVYTVTVNGTGLSVTPTTVTFDEVAVLTLAGTAPYDVIVTMDGTLLPASEYTYAGGVITFNAATTVTGDIIIDAVYTVTVNGTGLTVTPTEVTFDDVAVLTLAGTAPSDVKVTMNGSLLAATLYTYAGGVITFNAATTVTGDIIIDAVYTVTVNGTGLSVTPTTVTFDEVAVLTLSGTAPFDVIVTMDGLLIPDSGYTYAGGVITFNAGTPVTGDIVIDAVYTVTINGTGLGRDVGSEPAVFGSLPMIIITQSAGFPYDVIVTMNGVTLGASDFVYNGTLGRVTMIAPVDGNIVITAVYAVTVTSDREATLEYSFDGGATTEGTLVFGAGGGSEIVPVPYGKSILVKVASDYSGYKLEWDDGSPARSTDPVYTLGSVDRSFGLDAVFIKISDDTGKSYIPAITGTLFLLLLLLFLLAFLFRRPRVFGTVTFEGKGLENVKIEYTADGKTDYVMSGNEGKYVAFVKVGTVFKFTALTSGGRDITGELPAEFKTEQRRTEVDLIAGTE
jgi:energy-converting hydrogenase Eha subunit E